MAPHDRFDHSKPVLFVEVGFFAIFLNWVIHKFFSGIFYFFLQFCLIFISYLWRTSWTAFLRYNTTRIKSTTCRPTVRQIANENMEKTKTRPIEEVDAAAAATYYSSPPQHPRKLSLEDVKTVIYQVFDEHNDDTENKLGFFNIEVERSFEEEPSTLGEVKVAFDLFDENGDGFIDPEELKKVLSALGFAVPSILDCNKMISGFDIDGDGRIDFGEFTKLIELSFS